LSLDLVIVSVMLETGRSAVAKKPCIK